MSKKKKPIRPPYFKLFVEGSFDPSKPPEEDGHPRYKHTDLSTAFPQAMELVKQNGKPVAIIEYPEHIVISDWSKFPPEFSVNSAGMPVVRGILHVDGTLEQMG